MLINEALCIIGFVMLVPTVVFAIVCGVSYDSDRHRKDAPWKFWGAVSISFSMVATLFWIMAAISAVKL